MEIFTVGEIDGFADAGGVMQIVWEGNRARFVVNLDPATQRGLRAGAKLLALARMINDNQAAR